MWCAIAMTTGILLMYLSMLLTLALHNRAKVHEFVPPALEEQATPIPNGLPAKHRIVKIT